MKVRNERGNGFLELMMMTPCVLCLIFLGLDCGLSLEQRSRLSDSIRASINEQAILYQEKLMSAEVPQRIAATLKQSLQSDGSLSRNAGQLWIKVDLIEMDIAPENGALLHTSSLGSAALEVESGFGGDIQSSLEHLLEVEGAKAPSRFARPRTLMLGEKGRRFSPKASALAITVSGETRGLPLSPFRAGFKNIFRIEELLLVPVRQHGE